MDYQQAYDQAAPQYDPQINQINQQISQLAPQQAAQQSALDQAKVNAFKDITNQSNARGVLFSGVPIDQQSTYVGTKYLPAVANLKTSFNNTRNTLLGQINSLQAQRSRNAQLDVSNYQKAQADAAYKQAQLQLGYARLNNSQSNAANKPLTQQQTSAAILQGLNGVRGKDGYVSPQDYATAFQDWTRAGFSGNIFDNYFGQLKNPKNGYYGYAISQAR